MLARVKMPAWRNVLYRVRQFWKGWRARVQPEELAEAVAYLPPLARSCFQQLPADAQRHSLNVLHTLQQHGMIPTDLAAAALLHDVGKLAADEAGMSINLWTRGPLVLLERFAPQLLTRLAVPNPGSGWRYLLYVHQMHPTIGAQWAKTWGCTPLTCWLIEHHQDHPAVAPGSEAEQLLRLLQQADSAN
jgi:HD-like signal output (HDOD) protein